MEVERAAFVMKPSSDIPILRATNGEVLRANPLSRVVLSGETRLPTSLFGGSSSLKNFTSGNKYNPDEFIRSTC